MTYAYNQDCMIAMKEFPDKYFELAIVDPPYGIGVDGAIHIRKHDRPSTWNMVEKYEKKSWDESIPEIEYFKELFRVSKSGNMGRQLFYRLFTSFKMLDFLG